MGFLRESGEEKVEFWFFVNYKVIRIVLLDSDRNFCLEREMYLFIVLELEFERSFGGFFGFF